MPGQKWDEASAIQREVADQIESMIDNTPECQKSIRQLCELEAPGAIEKLGGSKTEYTNKKNRISAQLSRDWRSQIIQTLMDLCVQNIERRRELEDQLEGAKDVLKETICDDCKTNLKNQVTQKTKKETKTGGISIRGKGNAFILSLIALSVALVTLYSP